MNALLAASNNDFFGGIRDFFSSTTWTLIRDGLIAFVAVFWLAVAFWVFKDARRRIEDHWLVAMAAILGLVPPFVGALVYMLFRPPEYLDDVRERDLEIKEMEERLGRQDLHCPVCRAEVDPTFLVCPVCTTKLKQACSSCKAPLEPIWQICPFCETAIDTPAALELGEGWEAAAPRRRERRRR